jgi:choline dehydrogenase
MATGTSSFDYYDYIVVGGGTAGCVIASRLSETADVRVLLLEAGDKEPLDAMAVPAAWPTLMGTSADWADTSVVQAATGTPIPVPRGRGLGGSSSMNGLAFLRGHRTSYDAWPGLGASRWGYDDLLPFFRRSETTRGRDTAVRGVDGPLAVAPSAVPNPVVRAGIEAAVELGYERAGDITSGLETGAGWCDINVVDGVRQSAADAYLRPVLGRPNLVVVTEALVRRLRVENGRCTGVEYTKSGESFTGHCSPDGEVVLTAGAIGSPQLLMLSGIGPREHLRQVGVGVVEDLPGVGANLQDHPMSTVNYTAKRAVPGNPRDTLGNAVALIRTDPALAGPDMQFVFSWAPYHSPALVVPEQSYTIAASVMTPHSRGSVRLASSDAGVPPMVDPNYFGDSRDITTMAAGLRLAREIGQADAFADWRGAELRPGPEVDDADADAVRDYLFKSLMVYFHYTGTCRIGDDEMAVVDTDLRVRGVAGLRVADASVMPSIPSANTNATVYAIAERAASLLKD